MVSSQVPYKEFPEQGGVIIIKKPAMIRFTFLILILYSLITSSCSSRNNKLERKNLIPEDELVSILTEVYITDGLLTIPKIHIMLSSSDSLATYNHIFEEHGYSKEIMDKTIKYYFIKKPKKLIKIYDKVLGILSEMESRVDKEIVKLNKTTNNLWRGLEFYSFPDPSGSDSTIFENTLTRAGKYTLSVTVTIFPDDQSDNPRITAYSCHPDSIETGKRDYINPIYFIKDGRPHTYTIFFNTTVNKTLYIKGSLYDYDNNPDDWEKHLILQNISLTYSFV
jgi:hypothetical protein